MKCKVRSATASAILLLLAGATCAQADDLVCTQCVHTSDVADSAINGAKLKTDSITSAKIRAGEVMTEDIADQSITKQKLTADSVTSEKISAGQVKTEDIADFSISASKLKAGSITEAKLDSAMKAKLTAPQLVFAGAASTVTSPLVIEDYCVGYASISITVPGSGRIKVDAQAWLNLSGHTNGITDSMGIYLNATSTDCETNPWADPDGGYVPMAWVVGAGQQTWTADGGAIQTMSISRTFTIPEAGTHTFYLNGQRFSGSANGGFVNAALQALYFPDL